MKVIAAFLLAFAVCAAQAQSYPNRPITIVVPFAPGGVADITARPYAAVLSRLLGQPVVVENKAGAGGAVGHAYAARAKPDGYTLMVALSSIVAIPVADEVNGRHPTYKMWYCPPLALLAADPTVLIVRREAKWKTLKELIEDGKANPGKIRYGSSGI